MDLFWRQGYEATGVADLTSHLGIGRQSLYSTFGDKRGLFEEALSLYADTEVRAVIELLKSPGSPLGNLRRLFAMWLERSAGGHRCGCMVGNTVAELAPHDKDLADRLEKQFRRIEDAFARTLRRAQHEGELSADKNTRALARTLLAVMQGLAVTMRVAKPNFGRDVVSTVDALLAA